MWFCMNDRFPNFLFFPFALLLFSNLYLFFFVAMAAVSLFFKYIFSAPPYQYNCKISIIIIFQPSTFKTHIGHLLIFSQRFLILIWHLYVISKSTLPCLPSFIASCEEVIVRLRGPIHCFFPPMYLLGVFCVPSTGECMWEEDPWLLDACYALSRLAVYRPFQASSIPGTWSTLIPAISFVRHTLF